MRSTAQQALTIIIKRAIGIPAATDFMSAISSVT